MEKPRSVNLEYILLLSFFIYRFSINLFPQSEAFEGDTVIIGCEVVGDPTPDVIWLRDFLRVKR